MKVNPLEEKGNPDFNLNDAQPTGLGLEDLSPLVQTEGKFALDFNIEEMEKKRFGMEQRRAEVQQEKALAAITPEDLAFEAELQRMHAETEIPAHVEGVPIKLTKEEQEKELLSDVLEGTEPAKSLADLDQQVFLAKSHGCNSIEADEKVIRYFTRNSYPEAVGYFMYKDIKVFIPGKFRGHARTDKLSMHDKLFGSSKVK